MLDRYSHKLATAEAVRALVGDRPRLRKVIMAHGVFDIVHPGHVRHLLYAKEQADVLVCSVTADRHVHKGAGRPHVPQELRAMNLAALECVDHVVIDDNAEPLATIATLQPDYFAKGFEYQARTSPATARELQALHAYGGELIFTPGDVMYSSSRIMAEAGAPSLRYAKLDLVMRRHGLSFDGLRRTLNAMHGKRVHVVGDTIVDAHVHCALLAGQPKTPTIGALYERTETFAGGAAVVARHAAAAGATVALTTLLGDDRGGAFVVDELEVAGVEVDAFGASGGRPTTEKRLFFVNGQPVLKVDTVDNRPISPDEAEQMATWVAGTKADAVIFADFRHGLFSERTIPLLTAAIPKGALRAADSQVASRWGNILDFHGFDLITPNEREARFALGDQDSGIRPLASRLYDKARCGTLMMTLGSRGVLTCCGSDHESLDSFIVLDAMADEVVDPVGAGDAFLAYAMLAMVACGDAAAATILGNFAAAAKCGKLGNIAVDAGEMHSLLDAAEEAMR